MAKVVADGMAVEIGEAPVDIDVAEVLVDEAEAGWRAIVNGLKVGYLLGQRSVKVD
jgi:hypothetical protein